MGRNLEIERAREYHERTAHSRRSVRASRHTLDWDIAPSPYKIYPDLPVVALPRDVPPPAADGFAAISGDLREPAALDVARLAALLFFSAGVTRTLTYPGGIRHDYRAAASTGALYQTEVYVVAGAIGELAPGVYHFNPGDFALRRLRDGDCRGAVARAAADPDVAARPATVILSGLYWRNTWKYEARAYRHLFWDSGTMLANLLATATALGVPARVVEGFVEREVNRLLGLDAAREGALALVPVGASGTPAAPPPSIEPIAPAVIPLSSSEVSYPLLVEAYEDSSLETEAEVRSWRDRADALEIGSRASHAPASDVPLFRLPPPRMEAGRSLGETIQARGSTRAFSRATISAEALSSALYHATRGIGADVPSGLVDLYLVVHAVDGVDAGAYAYRPEPHALERLASGDFREESAFLCLEQSLGGASSVTVFFLADLGRVLGALGNRGYRAANLEAGIVGGRLYLAAYAQRFGASGLTFYDADVVQFFSPHARAKDAIFVTALGRSARRAAR